MERIDDTVLPALGYGYKSRSFSDSGSLFPGAIDMDNATVIAQIYDVPSGLITNGFTKVIVMNAHFESEALIVKAVDLVTRETGGIATIVETGWWDLASQPVTDRVFDGLVFLGWTLGHMTITGASLMLCYASELIHMDRMVEEAGTTTKSYVRYPMCQGDVPTHGGFADPADPNAGRGRLITETCANAVAEVCAEELDEQLPLADTFIMIRVARA